MAFHVKSGLTFTRLENGNVMISVHENAQCVKPALRYFELTADEWASVVAVVSIYGDSEMFWNMARAFHNGIPVPQNPIGV